MDNSERERLDARMVNWGRWSAEGGRPRGMSNLWPILLRMSLYAGRNPDAETAQAPSDQSAPVDQADAIIVERALTAMRCYSLTDRKAKELMIAVYRHPSMSLGRVCHAMSVRRRCADGLLARAFVLLSASLKRQAEERTKVLKVF